MLTPKIVMTNLRKQDDFVVGEYARSRSFGTRVYTVIAVEKGLKEYRYYNFKENAYQRLWKDATQVVLKKIGETNKGRFKFTNCKPFKVPVENMHWYYPAKGI